MYDVLVDLVRLVTPIIPHTDDEVWKYIPGKEELSVQLTDLPEANVSLIDDQLEQKWDQLIEVRDEVLKALEEVSVVVSQAPGEKCERCWMVKEEVGQDEIHPSLCPRCAETVKTHYAHVAVE